MKTATIIGLTGGIGVGKSFVSRILRLMGYKVYDCDYEAKRLMVAEIDVRNKLISRFGHECYMEDGTLNRTYLASIIFGNKEELKWMNSLIHSAVKKDLQARIEQEASIFFVESAILFSSGVSNLCDEVWVIDAPKELRIKRALGRGGVREDIERRILIQEVEEKNTWSKPSVRILNDGATPLLPQIYEELEKLIEKNKEKC